MSELVDKYITNRLSHEELPQLRQELLNTTDAQIAREMSDLWNGDIDISSVGEDNMTRMRAGLALRLNASEDEAFAVDSSKEKPEPHVVGQRIVRILVRVAACLMPLLLVASLYLMHDRSEMANQKVDIATGKGERTTMTLPDGTKVNLNNNSRLAYSPFDFGRRERVVNFYGEAWFDVAKDRQKPFRVKVDGFDVEVLGTAFNLSARPESTLATLALERGLVRISVSNTGATYNVRPSEVAEIDRATGRVVVRRTDDIGSYRSWQHHELRFDNAVFSKVISALENNYGVSVRVSGTAPVFGFTGTLMGNLSDALNTLKAVYGFRYVINGDHVTIWF